MRDPGEHEVPRVADALERPFEELVAALLEIRGVDGVVDVPEGIDVAPPDLDPFLVHGADRIRSSPSGPGRVHGVGHDAASANEYAGAMRNSRVFAMVLAGGEGKRLAPLTADRAKPAVPFGGNYRLIDFALSNLVNAGQLKIAVLTQYKSQSLDRHIATTWRLSPLLGNYVTPVPAQMRRGPRWFAGSADAIYQNLNLIYDERPRLHLRLRRRPRLPDGSAADARAAHRPRRRASRSPGSGCRSRARASSG